MPSETDRVATSARRVGSLVYHSFMTEQERSKCNPPKGFYAPLKEDFERHMRILADAGARPITYDQLYDWHSGRIELPAGSFTIDFDNVNLSQYQLAFPVLAERGWVANLAVNTAAPLADESEKATAADRHLMTWGEIRHLQREGWCVCSHTHTHRQMSALIDEDPTGGSIETELVDSIRMIERQLGVTPRHFAYVGRGWNPLAESIVRKHFLTGRLCISYMTYLTGGGKEVLPGEILDSDAMGESDGGPPFCKRYLTREMNRYRVPALDACNLPFTTEATQAYARGLFN
jgi:peptidoglycan/xylan/chitin deacetylase (PgdA/CDA1 family)